MNKVFEEFINLSTHVVNKEYEKMFRNYSHDKFNLESVFVMHLTNSILQEAPKKPTDYTLRAYFNKQIDFAVEYRNMLDRREALDKNADKTLFVDSKLPE